MENILEIYKAIPLFENIKSQDLPNMLSCLKAEIKNYKKGTYLFMEGDKADFIGLVLEGTLQVLKNDYDGRRTITAALTFGNLFAEAFALAEVESLPVSILATSDCTVMLIKKEQILNPCKNTCHFHTQLIQNLLKIVSRKNMMLNQKLQYISHKTTREKLMAYLLDQAKIHHSREFTIPYDRQALADYLGVERSAMSTEIGKLQKDGLIESKKNYFKLTT